ncbi:uncharacterized protein LOC129729340 [Wyeomyia smithii]|uniref:uncharacterized protein LOC129729340 n=1 Tax=Wyeomyia smithii TaxID=174621 RepID=UPI002467CCBF|nr:uncharacterized protein LOC129729340 [Wyeomyia smithii]
MNSTGSETDEHCNKSFFGTGADGGELLTLKKKPSNKRLLKELKEALVRKNMLREQVIQLTTEQNLTDERSEGCSSITQPTGNVAKGDSQLLSSMNNWTLGTLNIPECTPSVGETDIDKRAFEYWKDLLTCSLELISNTNEQIKFSVFKVKAGVKLREVYMTTCTTPGMPDEKTAPLSNAIARLDAYFGSRVYILSQRGKLMVMSQQINEKSIEYVRRVASAAKLCNYGPDEEMEVVVRVIVKGARDAAVRKLAHRNLVKKGTIKDLIDLVRDHEIEQSNEDEFQRAHGYSGRLVAAVATQHYPPQQNWRNRGVFRNRGAIRGAHRGGFYQGNFQNQAKGNCWRCGGIYHRPSDCSAMNKDCRACGQIGHLERMCSNPLRQLKRPFQIEEATSEKTVAAIEGVKDEHAVDAKKIRRISSEFVGSEINFANENAAFIEAKVAGIKVTFLIDSGAQINTITKFSFDEILANENPASKILALRSSTDKPLKVYAMSDQIKVIANFSAELFVTNDRPVMIEKFYVVDEARSQDWVSTLP